MVQRAAFVISYFNRDILHYILTTRVMGVNDSQCISDCDAVPSPPSHPEHGSSVPLQRPYD
jgi:hypothetical protein